MPPLYIFSLVLAGHVYATSAKVSLLILRLGATQNKTVLGSKGGGYGPLFNRRDGKIVIGVAD